MNNKRSNAMKTTINIITSVCVLIINVSISFFLSPYIIRTIGVEANGFVNLANNFVAYANLVVTALNAMAARFITIAYVKKDYKKANLYYNSVFWGNLIICVIMLVPAFIVIIKLDSYINVPDNLLLEVKILFAIVFAAFFIRTGAPNYDCGTYVTNRMDLEYIPAMFSAILRCVLILVAFSFFLPHIWYIGFISTLIGMIQLFIRAYNTHRLTPELKISLRNPICSWKVIRELVGSGIWNSISIAGNTLLSGVDLIICNIYLGPTLMGVLSLSKTLPSILTTLSESIRGAFGPELTISFASGDKDNIYKCIKRAMKITSVIVTIPTAGLIIMSDAFYSLWVPSQDEKLLQILTTLAVLSYLLNSGVVVLFNVFTTVNKVRYNSIAMIISGFISISLTLLIAANTEYDLYAIAGISSIVTICKNLFFTIPVASTLLGYKWYKFYSQVGISALCSGMTILVGKIIRLFVSIQTWSMFFLTCILIGTVGLYLNLMIVLEKEERSYLLSVFKRRLHLK